MRGAALALVALGVLLVAGSALGAAAVAAPLRLGRSGDVKGCGFNDPSLCACCGGKCKGAPPVPNPTR